MADDLDVTNAADRRAFAKKMAHMCIAMLPELPLAEMLCLVMDDADRLARAVGAHVARGAGEAYEEHEPSQLHGRPAPLALVLEIHERLGERLSRRLRAPIPPGSMRVLWLAPSQRHVIDVTIEAQVLAQTRDALENARLRDELELELEDEPATAAATRVRAVGGTWKDPMRYLPMPLPAGWIVDGADRLGVVHVIIDERIRCQVGALEPDGGKGVVVILEKLIGGRGVTDDEARAILDRLRNVRRFRELTGMEDLFGDGRAFGAAIVEGEVPGSA